MIALQVNLNGERVCTAGLGSYGLVGSSISWRRITVPDSDEIQECLVLIVSGLATEGGHQQWAYRTLAVGDRLRTTIVETGSPDSPIERLDEPIGPPWSSTGRIPLHPSWRFWTPDPFLGFHVSIPSEHSFQFGVHPLGVTMIDVSWACVIPDSDPECTPITNISLRAHSLDSTTGQMDSWADCRLSVGESVDVTLVWITHVDEPVRR
jgi:hypothetical protein